MIREGLARKVGQISYTSINMVWKGIRGAKYSAGFGKKAQFLDGVRDLTATQEMRFAKSLAWDAVLGKKTIFEVAGNAGVFFGRALKGCYFYSP